MTLKIDQKKAFDLVDLTFLSNTPTTLDFPTKFLAWIKTCDTTPKFSVVLNGRLFGYFSGHKGIRQ